MPISFGGALLALYYLVLSILAFYGLHRLVLLAIYFRTRDRGPSRPADPGEWPRVTVQLPVFNERYVATRLIDAICRLDCALQRCGDGVVDTGESCDDGNNSDGDGCQRECTTCQVVRDAGFSQCEQLCLQRCSGDTQFELFCIMFNCAPAWDTWRDACTNAADEPPRPNNDAITDGSCP